MSDPAPSSDTASVEGSEEVREAATRVQEAWRLVRDVGLALGIVVALGVFVVAPYRVEGDSMLPALERGDRLLVEKLSRRLGAPEPGTIVILRSPEGAVLVKRVAAAPDGQTVPEGELWVLGDNAAASRDSRHFGPVPGEQVVGRAAWRYWPPGRIGRIEGAPEED
ncbi:MAG: signal peptidase I [Acidobacteriota bacterium]